MPSTIQWFGTSKVGSTLPSGEKATEVTEPEWPSSVCSGAPVAASQSRTVRSRSEERRVGKECLE